MQRNYKGEFLCDACNKMHASIEYAVYEKDGMAHHTYSFHCIARNTVLGVLEFFEPMNRKQNAMNIEPELKVDTQMGDEALPKKKRGRPRKNM